MAKLKIKVKVKEYVARTGMTQKELAEKLHVKPETVYKWADGTNNPTFDMVYRLKEMGMTDYELFGKTFAEQENIYRDMVMKATGLFLEEMRFKNNPKEEA